MERISWIFVAVRLRFIELYQHTFLLARLPLVSFDASLLGLLLISAPSSYMEDESLGFAGHLQVVKTDIVMQTLLMLILHNEHCMTYLGSNINLPEVLPMKPQLVNEVLFASTPSVHCCGLI